ncbi:hypothetical protein GUITHDRAFT_120399 [Guillardia theta CCMP2712]|uniref:Uncharacterized protein n=1 Tax=Guillardia theta (strain CCMP2712) TaxID=905079 RepID=L1IC28_GUITC|nr:hypothetical protein GUITHDRAFT_120399 [Guillardia theta CCMP2712]EKX33395.1 hypothetical protein GUITHDRAFT_120399 [Guillardia theta CCMP2712]|eukprot:XP_005820375.1 hypothetical protein GUITHDRAFT_120399 [Guillardia theta CCMP2712]
MRGFYKVGYIMQNGVGIFDMKDGRCYKGIFDWLANAPLQSYSGESKKRAVPAGSFRNGVEVVEKEQQRERLMKKIMEKKEEMREDANQRYACCLFLNNYDYLLPLKSAAIHQLRHSLRLYRSSALEVPGWNEETSMRWRTKCFRIMMNRATELQFEEEEKEDEGQQGSWSDDEFFGDSANNTEKNTIDQEELLFMLLQDLFESISTSKISAAYSHFPRSKILRIYVQDMQEDAVGEDLLLLTNKWLR